MVYGSCCVLNCRNTRWNSTCKFYSFPTARNRQDQRNKWIAAVKRKNADGSPWFPKRHHYVCSDHFVGGNKSNDLASPSYIPTLFSSEYLSRTIEEYAALRRYKQSMQRRSMGTQQSLQATQPSVVTDEAASSTDQVDELRIKEESEDMDIGPTVFQHMDSYYKINRTEVKQTDEVHNDDDGKGLHTVENDQEVDNQVEIDLTEDSEKDTDTPQRVQARQPQAVTDEDSKQVDELHIKEEPEDDDIDVGPTVLQYRDSYYRTGQVL